MFHCLVVFEITKWKQFYCPEVGVIMRKAQSAGAFVEEKGDTSLEGSWIIMTPKGTCEKVHEGKGDTGLRQYDDNGASI